MREPRDERAPSARTHYPISSHEFAPWCRGRRAATRRGVSAVLSVWKLAAGQESYYLNSVAGGVEDYYAGGEAPGRWIATSDRLLGLSGVASSRTNFDLCWLAMTHRPGHGSASRTRCLAST